MSVQPPKKIHVVPGPDVGSHAFCTKERWQKADQMVLWISEEHWDESVVNATIFFKLVLHQMIDVACTLNVVHQDIAVFNVHSVDNVQVFFRHADDDEVCLKLKQTFLLGVRHRLSQQFLYSLIITTTACI